MLRLQCAIVESTRRHKHVPFVNIASLRFRSIKRRQWKHNLDYYGVVFAHLATGVGLMRKSPRGWIQIGESRTRGVARTEFTNLNPAPRGLSLYKKYIQSG